jgi:hypothetical protein
MRSRHVHRNERSRSPEYAEGRLRFQVGQQCRLHGRRAARARLARGGTRDPTQHIVTGDWSAWETAMLAETGTRIELPAEIGGEKPVEYDAVPDHKEHKKTLGIPTKKPQ